MDNNFHYDTARAEDDVHTDCAWCGNEDVIVCSKNSLNRITNNGGGIIYITIVY